MDEHFGNRRSDSSLRLFQLRFRTLGLSQVAFAKRFGLSVGTLRDAEQDRGRPSNALQVLVEAIALDPNLMATAAKNASPKSR